MSNRAEMKVVILLSCLALALAKPQYSYQPASVFDQSAPMSNLGLNEPLPATSRPSAPLPSAPLPSAPLPSERSPSFELSAPSESAASSFSTGSAAGSFAGQQQAQVLIQKHIYLHVPPQEAEEEAHHPHTSTPVQQQIHYKIIFIKAPSAPSISRTQLTQLVQPQTEEKTLVYVLTKKDDSLAELTENIQKAQVPFVPSKPEVYFIKYKTQKHQEQQHFTPSGDADRLVTAPAAPNNPLETDSIVTTAAGSSADQVVHNISSSKSASASGSAVASIASGSAAIPSAQKPSPVYGPAH